MKTKRYLQCSTAVLSRHMVVMWKSDEHSTVNNVNLNHCSYWRLHTEAVLLVSSFLFQSMEHLSYGCNASWYFLQASSILIRHPPGACVTAPVPHAIGVFTFTVFFHRCLPFHFVTSTEHFIAVATETHPHLTHAVLSIKTSDSSPLFPRYQRPLRPPFAATSPQLTVEYLPRQKVHGAVTQWYVARGRACRRVQLCTQSSTPWAVHFHALCFVDFSSSFIYLKYSQSVHLFLDEFRWDVLLNGCLWWFCLEGFFCGLGKDFGSNDECRVAIFILRMTRQTRASTTHRNQRIAEEKCHKKVPHG